MIAFGILTDIDKTWHMLLFIDQGDAKAKNVNIQSNPNGSSSLGPWEFVRDMGSSSHWGLIMALGQEATGDN